jgi:hypothetical protein
MSKKILFLVFVYFFTIAGQVSASVVLNEIAWMGYLGDANNEWIELYNSSSEDIDLSGWKIEAVDGTPNITIGNGTIGSQGYFLLERTDDASVPEVTADVIYTGALQNTGETLHLKDSQGVIVDTAPFSSGWTAPEDLTQTLSRFGNSWDSSVPTPRAPNQASEDLPEDQEEENDEEAEEGGDDESSEGSKKEEKKTAYKDRKVTIISEQHGYVGVPLSFTSYVRDRDGSPILRGIFQWNMGNGDLVYKNKPGVFTYTYTYPGEYVVSLSFNKELFNYSIEEIEPEIEARKIITVIENPVSIESVDNSKGAILLRNNSPYAIDLHNWIIRGSNSQFVIPRRSIINPGKTAAFSQKAIKVSGNYIQLFSPTGGLTSEFLLAESSVLGLSDAQDGGVERVSLFNNVEIFVSDIEDDIVESSTLFESQYTLIFIFTLVFIIFLLWYLFSSQQKSPIIEGYEIIEE